MPDSVFSLIDTLLGDRLLPSWHETARRDYGIPEECNSDPLLCFGLERRGVQMTPLAFVLEPEQVANTLAAVTDFLEEAFFPGLGRRDAVAVIDYLPPLDELGAAHGCSRRWVLDVRTQSLVLPEILRFLQVVVR